MIKATPHAALPRWPVFWREGVPIVLSLLLFVVLAEDVIEREPFRFDTPLLLWLHSRQLPLLDAVMLGFTRVGGAPMLLFAALLSLVLWQLKRSSESVFVVAALIGSAVLNLGAKAVFGRTRPSLWLSIAPEHDFGFPSGHAMLSSAFILAFLAVLWGSDASDTVKKGATILGVLFVAGIGLSRLYLGVHFPSDVLAGWALSLAWVTALSSFFRPGPRLTDARNH